MASEVVMPRLSDTMDSGTIARWLKHEGDEVKRGDIIAEIETDKANMELEAYSSGILARIIVEEGRSVALGEPIAMIAADAEEARGIKEAGNSGGVPTAGESSASSDAPRTDTAPSTQPQAEQTASPNGTEPDEAEAGGRIKVSPLARRLAQEHSIDLNRLTGTGPGGRITKDDVQSFLKVADAAPAVAPEAPAPTDRPQPPAPSAPAPAGGGLRQTTRAEMSRMQSTIARRMTAAKFSAPEFVLTAEYDMTEARKFLRAIGAADDAPKVGPNDLLIKAIATALRRHPEVNSGWEGDGVVNYGRVNIGNAVAIPGGLVVPVIQDADTKTLGQIAGESKALIERARANKLAPAEYEGGTFSVSNLGMFGIDQFTPIINVPEACIMGVGAITPTPVVIDGEVVVRDRMKVTLSCDHRVVNGAQGAEFLRTLRRLVENPLLSVL
ncbi:MAG TPA: dihydrolipoamide acetyltransferase family protein [Chloroflexota bacterium]